MVNLHEQTRKYEAWWRRANTRPLVNSYFPQPLPFGGLDVGVPPGEILERKLRNAEVLHASPVPQDSLITARVNFGTALYPAVAGAEVKFEENTSWAIHTAGTASEVRINKFDPGHPVYRAYLERLERLLAGWSWDTFLPVGSDYAGCYDILSAFLGPENLAVEMLTDPDAVRAAADAAADFMADAIAFEKGLFQSAGFREWTPTLFGTWQPGWSGLFVEDFSALVGPDLYRDMILEFDRRILGCFETALFHTHSAGYRNNLEMLALPEVVAFEFGNDPGGPATPKRIEVAQAILADGRRLMLGSWSIPLPDDEIQAFLDALPPQGLDLHFQCASADAAAELYRQIQSGAPIRQIPDSPSEASVSSHPAE